MCTSLHSERCTWKLLQRFIRYSRASSAVRNNLLVCMFCCVRLFVLFQTVGNCTIEPSNIVDGVLTLHGLKHSAAAVCNNLLGFILFLYLSCEHFQSYSIWHLPPCSEQSIYGRNVHQTPDTLYWLTSLGASEITKFFLYAEMYLLHLLLHDVNQLKIVSLVPQIVTSYVEKSNSWCSLGALLQCCGTDEWL